MVKSNIPVAQNSFTVKCLLLPTPPLHIPSRVINHFALLMFTKRTDNLAGRGQSY